MDKFNGWDDAPCVSPMKPICVFAYVVAGVVGVVGAAAVAAAVAAILVTSACIVTFLLGGSGCMS